MSEALVKGLLDPSNRFILNIVLIALGIILLFLMGLAIYLASKGTLNASAKLGPVRILLQPANSVEAPASRTPSYRKLLYVAVTHLVDRATASGPCYYRTVDRLEPADRSVAVYDEAVYYTLELYPTKRPLSSRIERSSGVVDARLAIPWQDQIAFRDLGAAFVKEMVQIDVSDSDTVLTISHFENGLQGPNQDFASSVPEDSDDIRLVVDFSSIPNAERFIRLKNAFIDRKSDNQPHAVGTAPVSPSLYMIHCTDAKKGDMLRMCFTFDWSLAT